MRDNESSYGLVQHKASSGQDHRRQSGRL